MNQPFIAIFQPAPKLWLTPARYAEWAALAEQNGIIIWNRDGEARCLTTEVIRNGLRGYNDYAQLRANGKILDLPVEVMYFRWDQTVLLDPQTYQPVKP